MRKQTLLSVLLAVCLLTGCGNIPEQESPAGNDLQLTAETERTTQTPTETTIPPVFTETLPSETAALPTETETTAEPEEQELTNPPAPFIINDAQENSPASPETPEAAAQDALDDDPAVEMTYLDTLEAFQVITMGELVTESNAELQTPDALVSTDSTGSFTVDVPYWKDGISGTKRLSYTVVDYEQPILTNTGNGAEVLLGSAFDLNSLVGYADNADRHPVLTYSGFVDTGSVGSYPITATVTDSSGNAMSWNLTIHVVSQLSSSGDNQSTQTFDEFMAAYPYDNVRYGIDVSKWQGSINFGTVRDAGCSFVLMRIGYGADKVDMDAYYLSNMELAVAAGLDVGVYFYSTASNEADVRFQADWIAEQLGGKALQFPVVFDWESFSNFQKYGMSLHDLNALYDAFSDQMAQHGYSTMLYSSKSRLGSIWRTDGRSIWMAHYIANTNYGGNFSMWQQSSHGRIAGIDGDVDLNLLYTDRIYW